MNHLSLLIYVYGMLDFWSFIIIFLGIMFFIGPIILVACISDSKEGNDYNLSNIGICCFCSSILLGILFILISIFIPSSKTFGEMIVLPAIVKNKTFDQITDKSGTAANLYLDKLIKDLKKD